MATIYTGIVELDTPDYKIFEIAIPEVDAINTVTALTFAAGGISNFRGVPQVYWVVDVTPAGDAPTVGVTFGLFNVTATGFSTHKTAVTAATAVNHTFRVHMMMGREYEI